MKKRRKIGLIIESSRGFGRDLLLGVANFAQAIDTWEIVYQERTLSEGIPDWLSQVELDGLIVRPDSGQLYDYVCRQQLPWVDLRNYQSVNPAVPTINVDESLVVQAAVDHLREIGHRRVAFCGFQNVDFSERRLSMLQEYAPTQGMQVHAYVSPTAGTSAGVAGHEVTSIMESSGIHPEPELAQWLEALPKPIGLLACNDMRGNQVLTLLRHHQIDVPEEVSVVGVDNDEIICSLSNPPMSSVDCNATLIGYRAAEVLERLISGQPLSPGYQLVRPRGVQVRVSTDTTAITDKLISQAMSFIRQHACEGIEVTHVVDALPVSRATLERRFRKVLDRSINEEINRVRIARIKQLLLDTDLKLSAVAKLTGFNHTEYMSSLFKKTTGTTPGQFRQNNALK